MFFGIVVGIVPILYMYLKYKYHGLPEQKQYLLVTTIGTFCLFIIEYIFLTAKTHEYIITAIVAMLLAVLIMWIIINSHDKGIDYVEKHGLVKAVEYERRKTILAFVLFVVCFILVRIMEG